MRPVWGINYPTLHPLLIQESEKQCEGKEKLKQAKVLDQGIRGDKALLLISIVLLLLTF